MDLNNKEFLASIGTDRRTVLDNFLEKCLNSWISMVFSSSQLLAPLFMLKASGNKIFSKFPTLMYRIHSTVYVLGS